MMFVTPVLPEPAVIQAPSIKSGDTWAYSDTHQRGASGFQSSNIEMKVQRVDADDILIGVKPEGSPIDYQDHLMGFDWSPLRLVDGKPVKTGRPLNFPMRVGESWTADYDNPNRYGRQTFAHFHSTYKVVGWEDVTTPAGTFHALKIESHEDVKAKLDPVAGAIGGAVTGPQGTTTFTTTQRTGPTEAQHIIVSSFDYVPAVKATVKTDSEQFDENGVRTSRETRVLTHYTLAGG